MRIELGWEEMLKTPIIAIIKKGVKIYSSVKLISKKVYEYETKKELIKIIEKITKLSN